MHAETMTFENEVKQRLVRLETRMEHTATKEDLARLETRLESHMKHTATKEDLARLETRLESHMEHAATKEDLKDLKIWFLSGVLGGSLTIASFGVLLAKWFFNP